MLSGYALRDAAGDLVWNGARPARMLPGIDALAALLAEEDDLISNADAADLRDIDDGEVHRHAAHDGRVFAADEHAGAVFLAR